MDNNREKKIVEKLWLLQEEIQEMKKELCSDAELKVSEAKLDWFIEGLGHALGDKKLGELIETYDLGEVLLSS